MRVFTLCTQMDDDKCNHCKTCCDICLVCAVVMPENTNNPLLMLKLIMEKFNVSDCLGVLTTVL